MTQFIDTASSFIQLKKGNDWGSIYYAPAGKEKTDTGYCMSSLGLELKAGQELLIWWPDGKLAEAILVPQTHYVSVSDHGHSSTVASQLYGIEVKTHGVTLWVDLDTEGLLVHERLCSYDDLSEEEKAGISLSHENKLLTDPMFFDVWEVTDLDAEGNRSIASLGFFSSKDKAEIVRGGDPFRGVSSSPKKAVRVLGQDYLLAKSKPIDVDGRLAEETAKLKAKARAKLTDAEAAALGLK